MLRRLFFLLIAMVLVAGACGSDDGGEQVSIDDDRDAAESESTDPPAEVDGRYLAKAAEGTLEAETGRFEMVLSFGGEVDGQVLDAAMTTTGAYDTAVPATTMAMDMGEFLEDMAALAETEGDDLTGMEMLGDDLSMEMIQIDSMMYLRMPMLSALGAMMGGGTEDIGDKWIAVDMEEMGASLDEFGGGGVSSMDPSFYLEMLEGAGAEVTPLGALDVRGTATTGYAVDVSVSDAITAQADEETAAEIESQLEALGAGDVADLTIPMEIYVDANGDVRRVVIDMSFADVAAAMPDLGTEAGDIGDLSMNTTIDFFDLGSEDIVIDAPPADETVDLSTLGGMFGGAGGGLFGEDGGTR
jgi:hypothetical protein